MRPTHVAEGICFLSSSHAGTASQTPGVMFNPYLRPVTAPSGRHMQLPSESQGGAEVTEEPAGPRNALREEQLRLASDKYTEKTDRRCRLGQDQRSRRNSFNLRLISAASPRSRTPGLAGAFTPQHVYCGQTRSECWGRHAVAH